MGDGTGYSYGRLVSKSGTKSVDWDYFGLKLDAVRKPVDDGSAVFRSCQKRIITKHGNTSNLLAHFGRTTPRSIHKQKESWMGRASGRHGKIHLRQ